MKISAAIIGKNSIKTLENTLLTIKGICSQIVFVDTGSTDQTPQLATRSGAEVYFFGWQNDFALARNFALRFVRNEWVLVIDTDEILTQIDVDKLQETILNNPNIGGFNVKIKNYLDKNDLNQFSIHHYTRLFRKHPLIQFSGRIHEQIRPSIERLGLEIADSDILIEHFGYLEKSEEKQTRNLQLLQTEIAENNNDVFVKYHLAQTEFSLHNFQKAKQIFLEIISSPLLSAEQIAFSKIRLGQILISENNFSEAEKYLLDKIEEENLDGLRLFVLAATKMSQHDFKSAYEIYNNPILLNSSYVDINVVHQAVSAIKQILKIN